jgi:hypothetical protein
MLLQFRPTLFLLGVRPIPQHPLQDLATWRLWYFIQEHNTARQLLVAGQVIADNLLDFFFRDVGARLADDISSGSFSIRTWLSFQSNDGDVDDAVLSFKKNGFEFWWRNLKAANFDQLLLYISGHDRETKILCQAYLFTIDNIP